MLEEVTLNFLKCPNYYYKLNGQEVTENKFVSRLHYCHLLEQNGLI